MSIALTTPAAVQGKAAASLAQTVQSPITDTVSLPLQ
jgi:hypothetical protein